MDMTKLKKILKPMEQAMTAAAFAEEGEFTTARSLMNESRRVLLALREGQADAKTLKYALNAVRRMHAGLDILTVVEPDRKTGREGGGLIEPFLAELKADGISYRLFQAQGCLKERIVEHTNSERDILFAVIESREHLDGECRKRGRELTDLWRTMRCPLVVVMEGAV